MLLDIKIGPQLMLNVLHDVNVNWGFSLYAVGKCLRQKASNIRSEQLVISSMADKLVALYHKY